MIDYLGYNLTEYKSFRQLELDYIKLRNDNELLVMKNQQLTKAYEQKCKQVLQMKNINYEQKMNNQNLNLKYKKLYQELLSNIQKNLTEIKSHTKLNSRETITKQQNEQRIEVNQKNRIQKVNKNINKQSQNKVQQGINTSENNINTVGNDQNQNNNTYLNQQRNNINKPNKKLNRSLLNKSIGDKSIFIHLQETQNLTKIINKLTQMTNNYLSLQQKYNKLQQKHKNTNKTLQKMNNQYKTEQKQKYKQEQLIIKQLHNLQNQLQQLNQINVQLQAKLNIKQKDKHKLQLEIQQLQYFNQEISNKYYQLIQEQQSNKINKEEDSQFALDFFTYQLNTLQSFFKEIISKTKLTNISNLLRIIYSDYEQLSEIFKEKLQIQYDLQDLQQTYKSLKNNSNQQNLLIETRRQIQTFRLQLLKHKQILRQKQVYIQQHFEQYQNINESQMKLRAYSYELQNKLYLQKRPDIQNSSKMTTTNQTARNILAKRIQTQGDNKKLDRDFNQNKVYNQDLKRYQNEQQTIDKQESHNGYHTYQYDKFRHDKGNKDMQEKVMHRKTSLKYKPTNNVEQLMNQIIKKDKDNLQKLFKSTKKSSSLKGYEGK